MNAGKDWSLYLFIGQNQQSETHQIHQKVYQLMKNTLKKYPQIKGYFQFPEFNPIQLACLPLIMDQDHNLIVSAPTSSGKTVLFELAILKYSQMNAPLCLYLAPIKSLCHEKYAQWQRKFQGLRVAEVTGDAVEGSEEKYLSAHITVGTPQKVDFLSRQNLEYLRKIRLLLVDEVHMLNFQERGATLEAIVSRIMSLNPNVRIVAVSATIPNITEVAEWLKVPKNCVCVFGDEYRPVKISKVVLGFKSTGNPFTFQRALNFKLLQVVRTYSQGRGSLVFCPTQRGTQSACQQIISMMREREFIENDKQLTSLVQAARQVANGSLQVMLPQGVAFHNASLSPQDRGIVQRLFLELKIKVLCTTSTLAMGINLPARLVVIKSTQCYKGSMKGYQEYTRIEIDQMMGRAGRPPFDTEGAVVIMTEKSNYNRYNSSLQLQNLESQLFSQMLEHLNAEISLGSICSLDDVYEYMRNSFCFIRMKKSPLTYGITGNVDEYVEQSCRKAVESLTQLNIIAFNEQSGRVFPKPLSHSISRSAVQVKSIAHLTKLAQKVSSERDFLFSLCSCQEIGRYNSKVEERKALKVMNEKNRFVIKEAISTSERKSFVLAQAQLSKRHIELWELRRQAADILTMLRRLNYCIKVLGSELKSFWLYYWASRYQKYFREKLWEGSEEYLLTQFTGLQDKQKFLSTRGIRTFQDLSKNLDNIGSWIQKGPQFELTIESEMKCFETIVKVVVVQERKDYTVVKITLNDKMMGNLKSINVCIGDIKNNLYFQKHLNDNVKETTITFPKYTKDCYKIAIIKEGIIGFDEFYYLEKDVLTRFDIDRIPQKPEKHRKSLDLGKIQKEFNRQQTAMKQRKSKSHEIRENFDQSITSNIKKKMEERKLFNQSRKVPESLYDCPTQIPITQKGQTKLPPNYRIRQPIEPSFEQDEYPKKQIKVQQKFNYKPLNEYKWKPGFEEILSSSEEQDKKPKMKSLKIVDSKPKFVNSKPKDIKNTGKPIEVRSFKPTQLQNRSNQPEKSKEKEPSQQGDVFSYFYNLF